MTPIISPSVAGSLPPLPPLLLAVLQDQLSPARSPRPLYRHLLDDPVICLDLLRRFGTPDANPLATLHAQLELLDDTLLRSVLYQHAARQQLRPVTPTQAHKRIWTQHARVSAAVQLLTAKLTVAQAGELALALQLLPLGALTLLQQHPERYPPLLNAATSAQELAALERTQFGRSGIDLAADLLQQLAPQSLGGDALALLLAGDTELNQAPPIIRHAALTYRLALPGFAPDGAQALRTALGDGSDGGQLRREICAAADQAEGDCLRALDLYDPQELQQHLAAQACFSIAATEVATGEPCSSLLRHAQHLLGGGRQLLFEPKAEPSRLQAVAAEQLPGVAFEELRCSREETASRLGHCFHRGTPTALLGDDSHALIDRQLLRLFGVPQLWYLPLFREGEVVAALVTTPPAVGAGDGAEAAVAMAYLIRHCSDYLAAQERVRVQLQDAVEALQLGYRRYSGERADEAETPLSVSQNYLEVLKRRLDEESPLQPTVAAIGTEIERLQQLISGWASPPPAAVAEPAHGDLNAVVRRQLRPFQPGNDAPASLQVDLAPEPLPTSSPGDILHPLVRQLLDAALGAKPPQAQLRTRGGVQLNGRAHVELMIRTAGIPIDTGADAWRQLNRLAQRLGASLSYRSARPDGAKLVVLLPCPPSATEKES